MCYFPSWIEDKYGNRQIAQAALSLATTRMDHRAALQFMRHRRGRQ